MNTTQDIATDKLVPSPSNPNKMSADEYKRLVRAMREAAKQDDAAKRPVRVMQALLVAPNDDDTYEIVDGEHRWRAWRELNLGATIACVVREMNTSERTAFRMGLNNVRGAVDLSIASTLLADLSIEVDMDALAAMSGISESEINSLLDALRAPADDTPNVDATAGVGDDEVPAQMYALEIAFHSAKDKARARRLLKRAAGASGDLATGLLNVLAEEHTEK